MNITANLRIPLFAGAGAMLFGIVCLCIFFLVGGGSRLAWGALMAVLTASFGLVVALIFDLKGSREMTTITTEYTFDRSVPQIRQWMYARSLGERYATEVLANYSALITNPSVFEGDIEKLTKDMILFSLAAYLETRQRDWQFEEENFPSSLGMLTTWKAKSDPTNPRECTKIVPSQISEMLNNAKNAFAAAKPVDRVPYLCLPPGSSIGIDHASLTLENPFCKISFFFSPPVTLQNSMMQPRSHIAQVPVLADGQPRFQTRLIGLRVTRKLSWMTAQHRDFAKYEKWSKAVVDGARAWFETKTESDPPWFGDDGEGEGYLFWSGPIADQGMVTIKGSRIINQSSQ
jgi:hypothetical protein